MFGSNLIFLYLCADLKKNAQNGADEDIEYEYDQNGNLTMDLNREICSIAYNCLNLPQRIDYQDGSYVLYPYNAGGHKLRTDYYINPLPNMVPQVNGGTGMNRNANLQHTRVDYCGNLVYENDTLKQVLFEGGYVTFNGTTPQYHFYIQDHQGNNRVVCNSSGTIEQVNHYYPYGGLFGESTNDEVQRYKYSGKELDRMHGLNLYDYGARQYDGAGVRFTSMDSKCENYYHISPYVYCMGNPVMYVDPDGRWVWDSNGNLVAQKGDDVNSMAKYLGTSSVNALQILNRCSIVANSKGILKLSTDMVLNKSDLWVGTKSKNSPVVNNTKEALVHYFCGGGKAADVGDQSTKELLSSDIFKKQLNKITTQKVESEGHFSVDMTDNSFHIGRTNVDYKVEGNGTSNSVTFILFSKDGFWDPDFIDEKYLGRKLGISIFQPDGMGPNLERGGAPYPYKTRTRTFFFRPTE